MLDKLVAMFAVDCHVSKIRSERAAKGGRKSVSLLNTLPVFIARTKDAW